jgi:hypothetical protein
MKSGSLLVRWVLGVVMSSFLSCVSDPPRVPAVMAPSNPNAPESPGSAAPTSPSITPAAATEERAISDAGAVYTCEMHPEVIRSGPGKCPKCGMTLVLRKGPTSAAAPSSSAQHQYGSHAVDTNHP